MTDNQQLRQCPGRFDASAPDFCAVDCDHSADCQLFSGVNTEFSCTKCNNCTVDYAKRPRCHTHCDFIWNLQNMSHRLCFEARK